MRRGGIGGPARRAANVAGALAQVTAGAGGVLVGLDVGRVSSENRTLVVPADYAFLIWSPIFALCLAYAVYQALPPNHRNALLGRVGWFTASGFLLNAAWEVLFPARQFLLAEAIIVGIFGCFGLAFMRVLEEAGERPLSRAERWLVALPLGLTFGWLTPAVFVSVATTLVAVGLLGGGLGEAVLGAVLLLACGALATAVCARAATASRTAALSYGAAVLWGLVGVVVNQHGASTLTSASAVVAAVVVGGALVRAVRPPAPGCGRAVPRSGGVRRDRRLKGWRA
jgi:hypothetical protein